MIQEITNYTLVEDIQSHNMLIILCYIYTIKTENKS